MSLTEQVKNILQDELNIEAIDDAAVQGDYPEWDSLTCMRVLAAVYEAQHLTHAPLGVRARRSNGKNRCLALRCIYPIAIDA